MLFHTFILLNNLEEEKSSPMAAIPVHCRQYTKTDWGKDFDSDFWRYVAGVLYSDGGFGYSFKTLVRRVTVISLRNE